jgi:heme-degrading monooxygenase HmoA
MISRIWHGWTTRANAGKYEAALKAEVLPGIHRVAGYRGAYLLRHDAGAEVEFVTITLFDDMEAVRRFAGDDYELAVIHPEAGKLLSHYDARSAHYETILTPEQVVAMAARVGNEDASSPSRR